MKNAIRTTSSEHAVSRICIIEILIFFSGGYSGEQMVTVLLSSTP